MLISYKSIMFETMVVGWVAIILVSHIPLAPTLISIPLIAHRASHVHYSLLFLVTLLTFFYTGIGALGCICMLC